MNFNNNPNIRSSGNFHILYIVCGDSSTTHMNYIIPAEVAASTKAGGMSHRSVLELVLGRLGIWVIWVGFLTFFLGIWFSKFFPKYLGNSGYLGDLGNYFKFILKLFLFWFFYFEESLASYFSLNLITFVYLIMVYSWTLINKLPTYLLVVYPF